MRSKLRGALVLGLVLLAGCASVPRESVELSATVGRDLDVVHTANRNLALMYFDQLLAQVDRFVDDVYRPYIIKATIEDLNLVADLQSSISGESTLNPLDLLSVYTEETLAKIEAFRAEMRGPIEAQRREVLESIDGAFQQLQTANAVVTGHLESVRRVHDAQSDVLKYAGLDDYRAKVATRLAALSDGVRDVLGAVRKTDAELTAIPGKIKDLTERLP